MEPIEQTQLANIPLRWMLHSAAPSKLYFDPNAIFSSPFLINCIDWVSQDERLGARQSVLEQQLEPYQFDSILYRVLHDAAFQEDLHGKGKQIPGLDLDISTTLHPTSSLRRPSRLSGGLLGAVFKRIPSALIRYVRSPRIGS